MTIDGLTCVLHESNKLGSKYASGVGRDEIANCTPSGSPIEVLDVDEYPACPDIWPRGDDQCKSYFASVRSNHGIWMDFTGCLHDAYDVAIVVSVQGINALTGLQTDNIDLEQYDKCPKHDIEFGRDGYCAKCGFKWPKQNYLSTIGQNGVLRLDGFRASNGEVRQFIFTNDPTKGVASQLIGDDRVYAIGIAFFRSRIPKELSFPDDAIMERRRWVHPHPDPIWVVGDRILPPWSRVKYHATNDSILCSCAQIDPTDKLEIGAGAKIKQAIVDDSQNLGYWNKQPSGVIYVNYCSEKDIERIVSSGKNRFIADGFMGNIKVGN